MIKKTGPDLLRQTLTRFWFYNIYVQKPYKQAYNFIYIFKLIYLIEIFLTSIRPLRKNTYLYQLKNQIRKNTYRLVEIGTNKLVTTRLNQQHNKLNIVANIFSRKTLYPKNTTVFTNKQIHFLLKKKLKNFNYPWQLDKKTVYTRYFVKHIKNQRQNNKIKNLILRITLQKRINRNNSLKPSTNQKKAIIKNYLNKTIKNRRTISKNLRIMRRIILRPLKTRKKIIFIENTKYFQRLVEKNKRFNLTQKNRYFKKRIINKKTLKPKNINQIKNFLIFLKRIKNKKKQNTEPALKTLYLTLKKKQKYINKNTTLQVQKNVKHQVKKNLQIIEKNWIYKQRKNIQLNNKYSFIKTQLFNQFLEFKLNKFLNNFTKNKYYTIVFKHEFTIPNAIEKLKIYEKKVTQATKFLKNRNKFYQNFINILPNIEMYLTTQSLAQQIATELSRTKKHWKVIKGIELLLIQTYKEMRKNPINIFSKIKGMQITIRGRPNKISRTKTIMFKIGVMTKASYKQTNVTKSFAKSNAQIGSFGIHILTVQ